MVGLIRAVRGLTSVLPGLVSYFADVIGVIEDVRKTECTTKIRVLFSCLVN